MSKHVSQDDSMQSSLEGMFYDKYENIELPKDSHTEQLFKHELVSMSYKSSELNAAHIIIEAIEEGVPASDWCRMAYPKIYKKIMEIIN